MNANETKPTELPEVRETAPATMPRRFFQWLVIGSLVLAFVVLVVIYTGIRARAASETALTHATDRASVLPVSVVHPTPTSESQDIVLPGNAQAFSETPIYARTSGYLKRWYADIGTHVRSGQLLAEIDTPETDQQLQQARADLKNAQANEQLAQITATRWLNLLKTNSVSRQETDQAVGDLNAKQAAVDSMTANVHRLEQLQSFEKIYAPFEGVITARNTDVGALIAAGANNTPKELFHIASVNRLRIYVALPEVDASAAQNGAKATITLDEFPGEIFHGTIVRNSNAIDPASRTLNVEVDLDNASGRIKPGAYAFVHLKAAQVAQSSAQSFTVPANALLFRSEGLSVAVARNGHAQLLPVTIGRDFGASVEIVAGLTQNDQIILNPSDSLTNGTAVQVTDGGNR